MLTHAELLDLHRTLREKNVLSVFLDGTETDVARKRIWRKHLDNEIARLYEWMQDSPRGERQEFDRSVGLLRAEVAQLKDGIGAPGWAAFVTVERVWHTSLLQAPMPSLTVWSTGICASPYIRALKQLRPVILVVADARHAITYRYVEGKLAEIGAVESQPLLETASHMSNAPRQGFHFGVRGSTGRDEAQRALQAATDHMFDSVVADATRAANHDAWVLLGGIPHVARKLARQFSKDMSDRVLVLDSLDVHSTEAQLASAAAEGASLLRDEQHERAINRLVDIANANGKASLGATKTLEALQQGRVHELFFTRDYFQSAGIDAEASVRLALDHGAIVEEVEREAADLLSLHGGICASLRF